MLLAGLLLLGGCTTAAPGAVSPSAVASAGASPVPYDLLLPTCGKAPSPAPDQPPPGAILPPGTRLTAVREQPPLTQLNGYVEMTPIEVRAWVEARDDLTVQLSEDEGYESELLVSRGEYTTFIKARAVCKEASVLAEVIAPREASESLPTPAGRTPSPGVPTLGSPTP